MLSFKSFLLEASLEKNHLVLGNKYRNRIISAIENDDLQLAKSPNTKIVVINKEDLIQRIKDAKTKDQLSAIFNRDTYPFETKEHGKLKLKDIDKSPFSGYGGSGG